MHIFRSSLARKRFALILALIASTLLFACAPDSERSTFEPAGPVAQDQEDIFVFIFWIAVVVFVLVEGALLYSIFRYRRKRWDENLPTQTHGNFPLEIAWTIAPVVVLVAIGLPTVFLIFDQDKGPVNGRVPEDVLEIEAIGHQWWFEFAYPGEDVVTANELHIPTDTAILVSLASDDVIHSFWVPRLAGKVDMVPGDDNFLFLQADEPGTYLGQCAEFCGEAHANMRFQVIAQEPDDYQAWLDGMRRPPAPPVAGSAEAAGQALFAQSCSTCHTNRSYEPAIARAERETQTARHSAFAADPVGTGVLAAPNLTHLGLRQTLGAGLVELNEANLERWITDPDDIKKGNRMKDHAVIYTDPARALSAAEVDQIAKYLLSLVPGEAEAVEAPVSGNPIELGQAVFTANGCSGCHSTGTDTVVGPGLGGISDRGGARVAGMSAEDYVRESVVDPGAHVVEGFLDGLMPKNFGTLLSEDDLDNLVAYLMSLE